MLDGKITALVHFPEIAKSLGRTGKYDFVFYGHTHKPWIEKAKADANGKEYILLNPGTAAGEIYPPTFAIWETETDNFNLIRVHDLK
jgi:predicted phosphodiesterase